MEFVDRHRLGPLYRFVHNHRVTEAAEKIVGYRDLEKIRHSLRGVIIRRKRDEVLKQLPARIDQNFLVPLTPQQQALHDEYKEIVAKLVAKWRRYRFLCEADQRRMQIALAMMRMSADNTYLVDHTTVHGPKTDYQSAHKLDSKPISAWPEPDLESRSEREPRLKRKPGRRP